jgi:hypothetical protein
VLRRVEPWECSMGMKPCAGLRRKLAAKRIAKWFDDYEP